MQKKHIGLLVAIETEAVFAHYKEVKEEKAPVGFRCYTVERDHYVLHILKCGMGEVAAAAGVQYLATKYEITVLFNFGVVGGLTPQMGKTKVCLVTRAVHYKYDCSEFMNLKIGQVDGHDSIFLPTDEKLWAEALRLMPELPLVTCCSGDKFVGTAEEKAGLHEKFEGDICDMESAGIVLACEMNQIPCLLLKAVSDGLSDGADGFYAELQSTSLACLRVMDALIARLSF